MTTAAPSRPDSPSATATRPPAAPIAWLMRLLVLAALAATVAWIIWGVVEAGYYLPEIATQFVVLGIVSGVKRFQQGQGNNMLVYGNCLQVDSSINPGNSGGPLVDMCGRVVGVNTFVVQGPMRNLNFALSTNDLLSFLADTDAAPMVSGEICEPLVARPSPAPVAPKN